MGKVLDRTLPEPSPEPEPAAVALAVGHPTASHGDPFGRWALATTAVAGLLLGLWVTAGAWGQRPPAGADTMAHLVRTDFGIRHLLAHGRLDGWSPRVSLGNQEYIFNGPGLTWMVAVTRALTLGRLSTPAALTFVTLVSFLVLPWAVAFLGRSLGLSRLAAGLAGMLSLCVSTIYGVGIEGTFLTGLLGHQVAAPLFCLALGGCVRLLKDRRPRTVVLTAVTLVALLVTHLITGIVLAAFVGVILGLAALERALYRAALGWKAAGARWLGGVLLETGLVAKGDAPPNGSDPVAGRAPPPPSLPQLDLRWLVAAGALAVAIAGWWLVPLLAHRGLRGPSPDFGTPALGDRLSDLWAGRVLFRPFVARLVLLGLLAAGGRVLLRRPFGLVVPLTPLVYLVLAHQAVASFPANIAAVQLANRGLPYAGIFAALSLGAVVAALARRVGGAAGPLLSLGLAALVVTLGVGPLRALVRQSGPPTPALVQAAGQLRHLVPPAARFAMEPVADERAATGETAPWHWLSWAAGRNTLNPFDFQSSTAGGLIYEADALTHLPADVAGQRLARLGISHVVVTSGATAARLDGSARFAAAWRSATAGPPVWIFAVVAPPGQPLPASLVSTTGPAQAAVVGRPTPEHLHITVDAGTPVLATVATAWWPKWHARLDGHRVPLRRAPDGLMTVALPAGHHTLALRFSPDGWDAAGLLLTGLTITGLTITGLAASGLAATGLRRRRQGGLHWRRAPVGPAPGAPE